MLKFIRQIVIFIYLYAIHKSNTEEIEILKNGISRKSYNIVLSEFPAISN